MVPIVYTLMRCCQYAWTNDDTDRWWQLRNEIDWMVKQLHQRFNRKRIQGLHSSNPFNWRRETKRLTGQTAKSELTPLANGEAGGDIQLLANLINDSLQRVSCNLSPLPDNFSRKVNTIPAEYEIHPTYTFYKLSKISFGKNLLDLMVYL
jgi:hypothetical protein